MSPHSQVNILNQSPVPSLITATHILLWGKYYHHASPIPTYHPARGMHTPAANPTLASPIRVPSLPPTVQTDCEAAKLVMEPPHPGSRSRFRMMSFLSVI